MDQRISVWVVVALVLQGASSHGCAVEPFAGGRVASLPKRIASTYEVTTCTITQGQKRIRLKKPVLYLVAADAEGLVYEKSATGRVLVFVNRWTDKRGTHSLIWVYGGPYGYHVILPWVASKPAVRLVWRRRDLHEVGQQYKPKPKAVPYATCPMERKGRPRAVTR